MLREGVGWVLGLGLAAVVGASGCYGSSSGDAGAGGADDAAGSGASAGDASGAGTGSSAGRGGSSDVPPAGIAAGGGAPSAGGGASSAGGGAPSAGGGGSTAGVGGAPTAGTAGPGEMGPPPDFDGAACEMGESVDCACANGGIGVRICRFDAASPTNGSFGPCDACSTPAVDAGVASACLGHTLRFGYDGGFVAYQDSHQLGPCAEFSMTRADFGGGTNGACENVVYDVSDINVDTVLELLSWPEVRDAFAEAPVFYGNDGRAFDAPIFHLELDGAVVELGLECSAGSGGTCTPIPADVTELRELLMQLVEQQRRLPDCDVFP